MTALWLGVAVSSGSARDHTPTPTRPPAASPQEATFEEPAAVALLNPPRIPSSTAHDPALVAARDIARRVRRFHSFRGEIPLATWRNASAGTWHVRSSTRCLAEASKLHLPTTPLERTLSTPVPAPVVLNGSIGGVAFRPAQADRAIELSCELATRLPALAALLRKHGVRTARVNSSYREQPRVSFHTFGLALDIASFETVDGPLVVATDFELSPGVATCDAKPVSERGRALLALACDLAQSGLFSSVLTPNYNAGHRDHFHLDVRPDDPRLFLR